MRRAGTVAATRLAALLALAGGALALGSRPAAATRTFVGLPVARVEILSDVPVPRARELVDLLAVEAGRPLGHDEIARSLRNLQASGVAGEIEARVRRAGDGLVVSFDLWGRLQVEKVRLEGELGLDAAELRRVLEQKEFQPLSESQVVRSVYRLQDLYTARGYLDAVVRVGVDTDPARKQASVTFRVEAGPAYTVGSIDYEGELGPYDEAQLTERLQSTPGNRFRQKVAETDAERLENWLLEKGHRLAIVELPRRRIDWETREVHLVFPIRVGPLFELIVAGSESGRLQKSKLLPFQGRERYDEAVLLQAVARIRSHYQKLGHYRVAVDWREERTDDVLRLVLSVEPGDVYELTSIRFEGNERVDDATLAVVLSTSLRRVFSPGSGRLVDQALERDLANLRSFYLLRGYGSVEVGPADVGVVDRRIELTIPIREGPRRRVVDIAIAGVESIPERELRQRMVLTPGGPFHPRLLERSVDAIRLAYEERGYESTQVSTVLEWSDEQTLVDVEIQVLEGPRSVADRIILRGQRHTRSSIVRRAMELEPGEPINTARLLEVQRNLYALGIFSRVEVAKVAGTPYSGRRDVVVRVEEGAPRRVAYGFGYDTEDGFRGTLSLSRVNLFGRGVAARFDLRLSEANNEARILVRQPFLGRFRTPVAYSLFNIQEKQESFDSRRRGGQVEITRYRKRVRTGLLYTYNLVQVENPDPALEDLEIDRNLRDSEISSFTPNVLWDHRDDPLDPTRGWSADAELEYAFPFLNAKAHFVRVFAQQTGYLRLGPLGVAAASLRLGGIEPLTDLVEDPTLPPELNSKLVPIAERFFSGGRTTHRAYKRDTLGIPGRTLLVDVDPENPEDTLRLVPVGGNGLLLVNLDWRFPIAGPVGGTLFVDSGNVWADWRDIDPREMKTGVGCGVRYLSPIGLIRLEAGWKLDRLPSEDGVVIFFSFGNVF